MFGQFCGSISLILEDFRTGLWVLINLLLQSRLQLFLSLLDFRISLSFGALLRFLIFRLTRYFALLLSEFVQPRQLLQATLILLNRLPDFLQLLDRLLCSLTGLRQLLFAGLRGVL